jgi:hypothetical protein
MIFLPNIHIHEALTYDFSPRSEPRSNHNFKKWKKNVNSINNLLHTLMTEFRWAKPIIGDHGKCIMLGGKICLRICTQYA